MDLQYSQDERNLPRKQTYYHKTEFIKNPITQIYNKDCS